MNWKMKLGVFSLFYVLTFVSNSFAQNQTLQLKQTKENGVYYKGERMTFTASFENVSVDSARVKIIKNFTDTISFNVATNMERVVFNEIANIPSSVIVELYAGKRMTSLGAIIEPGLLTVGTKRPDDIEQFWAKQKKRLYSLPFEVKRTQIKDTLSGYSVYDVEINCIGPRSARGYLVEPKAVKKRTLPIIICLHGAGVSGYWCRSNVNDAVKYAKEGKGAICFDLNAHGMLNGQSDKYYKDLENGELKNYREIGIENRDSCYFLGMYLRLLRTIDYLTKLPEWDGKRILLYGGSQGGGQALAGASLDTRVTAAVAQVPAMCDWGATLNGKLGAWPNPYAKRYDLHKMITALPYFDIAHLIDKCKAVLLVETGLIDNTCPSVAIHSVLNYAKCKIKVFDVPYRDHHAPLSDYEKQYNESVGKTIQNFIIDYLK